MFNKLICLATLFLSATTMVMAQKIDYSESYAMELDNQDPLKDLRNHFHIPPQANGKPSIYFIGNSLGLQPKRVSEIMHEELTAWAEQGVEGHMKEVNPWYTYHTLVRDSLAKIVGAKPTEVVAMNSLTVNLHLMMVSFYQPTPTRYKILMEAPVFSSDTYAIDSQVKFHGYQPEDAILVIAPREGENHIRTEDINALLDKQGDEIALVLFSGVNYFNGQFIDVQSVTKKAHEKGALIGFDLAHAVAGVPLYLHDWNVDFAAWCSYKYLNAGPGAIGGVFVHEKHHTNPNLNRFAGWWGNDPDTRFDLHLRPEFTPVASADGWQLSNPSIFALVPLRASLEVFDMTSMEALRTKSTKLTEYLLALLGQINTDKISIITPKNPKERGGHISIQVNNGQAEKLMEKLKKAGVVCDFRKPDVVRVAPVPMYNTFHEVWEFVNTLKATLQE